MKDNQAKYPQLRFKGFTDHWEKRTLGQTTTKAKSYSLSRDVERDHETGYRYIHYGDIHTGVADIVTEHTKLPNIEPANYDELRVNDLVVADASEDYQGIAEPAVVVGLPTHLVAGLHTITLRPSSASSLYLYYLLHTDSFKHFGYQMGTGLKVFGISWSNLSKFTFMIPSRPEQEMIVKLIESVDNLIAVNQRKLAKLKELKQGYLQKMFPQNGSKFPQLRFAGFADAWEQRKLQEVLRERNNQQPQSMEYPLVSFTVENGVTPKTDRYEREQLVVGDKSSKKYKVTVLNDIVYNPANLKFGAISRNKYGNAVFSPIYITFLVNNDVTTPEFIEMFVTRNDFIKRALKYQQGTVYERQSVSPTDLLAMNVYLPGKSEQEKIGSFFQQLDETIVLHQRKLEKLQELKKGYLQKMFC
jgi:type I restriction enzyme S subunit